MAIAPAELAGNVNVIPPRFPLAAKTRMLLLLAFSATLQRLQVCVTINQPPLFIIYAAAYVYKHHRFMVSFFPRNDPFKCFYQILFGTPPVLVHRLHVNYFYIPGEFASMIKATIVPWPLKSSAPSPVKSLKSIRLCLIMG